MTDPKDKGIVDLSDIPPYSEAFEADEKPIHRVRRELNSEKEKDPNWDKSMSHFKVVLDTGLKFKARMIKLNIMAARVPCPICKAKGIEPQGKLHGRLVPRKLKGGKPDLPSAHMHMRCDGGCKAVFME